VSKDRLIAQMKANRFLRTRAEVEAFDEALDALASLPLDEVRDSLPELLLVFEDSAEHFQAMWGLMHYIEDFDLETELHALEQVLPTMSSHASKWATRLVDRILNSESDRPILKKLLPTLSPAGQAAIRQILKHIATCDDEKRAQVEVVLGTSKSE
jgi:hypothetical protein